MRKHLNEEVGVPENLVETAFEIYNRYLTGVKEFTDIRDLNSEPVEIRGDYRISDYEFREVEIETDLIVRDLDRLEIVGAGFSLGGTEFKDKYRTMSFSQDTNRIGLIVRILSTPTTDINDVVGLLESNKKKLISTMAHELKHAYDVFKKPEEKTTSRSEYRVYSNFNFDNITPLNKLLFDLYFSTSIENLVRPSEFAATLKVHGIDKKDFYDFMVNDKVFKQLKEIRDFSYEGLRESLKGYLPQIGDVLSQLDVDYENLSESEMVDKILRLFYINLVNWKVETLLDMLPSPNPFAALLGMDSGMDSNVEELITNYRDKLQKYEGNPEHFYKTVESEFKSSSNKMIRKLGKVYSIINKDEVVSESTPDFDIWTELLTIKPKITTEIKNPLKR